MPVYNAGKYLEECLESILAQDFGDWELVIVEDCSTDNSLEIIRRYMSGDKRIRLFQRPHNSGGAYLPRVEAAMQAYAEYLVIIDADDVVSDNMLTLHRRRLDDDMNGADLLIPEMWRLQGGKTWKTLPLATFDADREWEGKQLVEHTLCRWEFPMAGFAVRRKLYLDAAENITEDDQRSIFADELLSRHILVRSERVAFTKGHYYYRVNESSVTHTDVNRLITSKMYVCERLVRMSEELYEKYSPTHLKALEDKFWAIVSCLRLVNSSRREMNSVDINSADREIKRGIGSLDMNLLKGRIGPRYYALMRLPAKLARFALRILDPLLLKQAAK